MVAYYYYEGQQVYFAIVNEIISLCVDCVTKKKLRIRIYNTNLGGGLKYAFFIKSTTFHKYCSQGTNPLGQLAIYNRMAIASGFSKL